MAVFSRREFIKLSAAAAVGMLITSRWDRYVLASITALLDPTLQPKFEGDVPNALDPSFVYAGTGGGNYQVGMYQKQQALGLINPADSSPLMTTVWGYGESAANATFPGRTFIAQKDQPVNVQWTNNLVTAGGQPLPHLLPVDLSIHWAYSLPGYTGYTLGNHGVPVVPHLHGGHTESDSDGNPEYFWSPTVGGQTVYGPRFVKSLYHYDNDQEAATLWYHDHSLGLTRLNVYAGLAGFYILRDAMDTGLVDNPLGLPAFPYEAALVIQDRMFDPDGQLFYPGLPGDPAWADFITDQGLADEDVPQPSVLAEFFGDHVLVNGALWPKMSVEPRHYRLRLLNGSDSRFYVLQLRQSDVDGVTPTGSPISFYQIGTDDGLLTQPVSLTRLILGPGERADLIVDFTALTGRIILENTGPDEPFRGLYDNGTNKDGEGGTLPSSDPATTGLILAFDVNLPLDTTVPDAFVDTATLRTDGGYAVAGTVANTRKLALFEGRDPVGRLEPLLGVAVPTTDFAGNTVNRSLAWFEPITEFPTLNDVEIWEIYNATEDAHPIHLHLVSFEVINRESFTATTTSVPTPHHDGSMGIGRSLSDIVLGGDARAPLDNELGPKDTIHVFPGEVTRVKAKFDRPGRYVWHCHILSHEDHEMMRPYHVVMKTYMPLISQG